MTTIITIMMVGTSTAIAIFHEDFEGSDSSPPTDKKQDNKLLKSWKMLSYQNLL